MKNFDHYFFVDKELKRKDEQYKMAKNEQTKALN